MTNALSVTTRRGVTTRRAVTIIRGGRSDTARRDSVRRRDFAGRIGRISDGSTPSVESIAAIRTADGRLRLTGRINSCDVVYEYEDEAGNKWGELRLAEHVLAADVLAAWQLAPLTDDHPVCWVTPDNYSELAIGTLGSNVRPDELRKYTLADIGVGAASAISKIERGKTGLSCGYGCDRIEKSGSHNGANYSFIQVGYIPNHVSIVDMARGPGCAFIIDGIRSISGATA